MTALFTGMKIAIQSVANGSAKTITAITLATTAVVSAATHGFTNGQYVLITTDGSMPEVNGRIFRVANITAGTFELEGINSTAFGAFTGGSAVLTTIGQSYSTIQSVSASGGDPESLDRTTVHDTVKKAIFGLRSAAQLELITWFEPANPALILTSTYNRTGETVSVLITFSDGKKIVMPCVVAYEQSIINNTNTSATNKITLVAQALPTTYPN